MAKSKKFLPTFLSGDTLVEVMFAVGIFGIVAVSAISVMNHGLRNAQGNLEVTMARQEIDVQAESLRFVRDAYIAEKSTESDYYTKVWQELLKKAYTHDGLVAEVPSFFTNYSGNNHACADLYEALPRNAFVINPRVLSQVDVRNIVSGIGGATLASLIVSNDLTNQNSILHQSATHPRLLFTSSNAQDADNLSDASETGMVVYNKNLSAAEGIWVTAVESSDGIDCTSEGNKFYPDFYDFHIRTCWNRPGSTASSTISSTIRLFNPDQVTISSDPEHQPICSRRHGDTP